jgi:hypothetical protein
MYLKISVIINKKKFKVGAIRSRDEKSQLELTGSLHCDYQDDVNKKTPNERPQSIIVALDPFNLLYECNMDDGSKIRTIHVNRGQVVVFTSSFRHPGGSNGTVNDQEYVYRLFAYIVSEEVDYPPDVTTRVSLTKH